VADLLLSQKMAGFNLLRQAGDLRKKAGWDDFLLAKDRGVG
jgi:hypothetical protein